MLRESPRYNRAMRSGAGGGCWRQSWWAWMGHQQPSPARGRSALCGGAPCPLPLACACKEQHAPASCKWPMADRQSAAQSWCRCGRVGPVSEQTWQGWAQSRCICGKSGSAGDAQDVTLPGLWQVDVSHREGGGDRPTKHQASVRLSAPNHQSERCRTVCVQTFAVHEVCRGPQDGSPMVQSPTRHTLDERIRCPSRCGYWLVPCSTVLLRPLR